VFATRIGLVFVILGIGLLLESVVVRSVMERLGVTYASKSKLARSSPFIGLLLVLTGMFIRGDLGPVFLSSF